MKIQQYFTLVSIQEMKRNESNAYDKVCTQ